MVIQKQNRSEVHQKNENKNKRKDKVSTKEKSMKKTKVNTHSIYAIISDDFIQIVKIHPISFYP